MCGRPKIVQSDPAADAARAAEQATIAANSELAKRKQRAGRDRLAVDAVGSVLGTGAAPLGNSLLGQGGR